MTCPRCGYPTSEEPCELCHQIEFNSYEMKRFTEGVYSRFELTIIFSNPSLLQDLQNACSISSLNFKDDQKSGNRYLFIPDNQKHLLPDFLQFLGSQPGWKIMINGRNRPFTEELWLPLFGLTEIR